DVASRLAIVLRIWVRGTSWYGGPSTAVAAAGERGAGSGSIRCPADGGDADVPVAAVRSRSFLTTRPPGPDPVTSLRSTPASLAMRRASGDAFTRVASAGAVGVGRVAAATSTSPRSPLATAGVVAGRRAFASGPSGDSPCP